MDTNWKQIAQVMWESILARVKVMREEGYTLQEISDKLGVSSRGLISEWVNGTKKAEKASFAQMMEYLEGCELDYRSFFPATQNNADVPSLSLQKRIEALEQELLETRTERDKALGAAEVLRDMIEKNSNHSARDSASDPLTGKPSSSNSRTG